MQRPASREVFEQDQKEQRRQGDDQLQVGDEFPSSIGLVNGLRTEFADHPHCEMGLDRPDGLIGIPTPNPFARFHLASETSFGISDWLAADEAVVHATHRSDNELFEQVSRN